MSNGKILLMLGLMISIVIAFAVFGASSGHTHQEELREKLRNAEGITYDPNALTFKIIEPNEVSFSAGGENEIICNSTREEWLAVFYTYVSGKEPTGQITVRFDEPNEPKTYTIEEIDEIYKDEPALGRLAKDLYGVGEGRIVLREDWHKLIPTWPDYIELEKTLILRYDYPEPNTTSHEVSILPTYEKWVINKGTKIYFKEDE